MTEINRCLNCKWWELDEESNDMSLVEADGYCHRYPPVMNHTQISTEASDNRKYKDDPDNEDPRLIAGMFYAWSFPVVEGKQFCGEWQEATDRKIDTENIQKELDEISRSCQA